MTTREINQTEKDFAKELYKNYILTGHGYQYVNALAFTRGDVDSGLVCREIERLMQNNPEVAHKLNYKDS